MCGTPLSLAKCIALFAPFICQANLLYPTPLSLFPLFLLTALKSSCPSHSFHSPHVHSSLGFLSLFISFSIHLFPRYMYWVGGWWDMRHTFKCQLPATANGFLLPVRSGMAPLPLFTSLCLSFSLAVYHSLVFLCFIFNMPHTPRCPPLRPLPCLPFPTSCNCSTIFFLETCVNYRRYEEGEGGCRKGNVGGLCVCVCVLGGTPRG